MKYPVSEIATDEMYINLFVAALKTCGISGEKIVNYLLRNTDNAILIAFGKQCSNGYDTDDVYYQLVTDYDSWYEKLKYQFGDFAGDIDVRFTTACREYRDICENLAFTSIDTWR